MLLIAGLCFGAVFGLIMGGGILYWCTRKEVENYKLRWKEALVIIEAADLKQLTSSVKSRPPQNKPIAPNQVREIPIERLHQMSDDERYKLGKQRLLYGLSTNRERNI